MKWQSTPTASLALKIQLPVASFDSIFPVHRHLVTASRNQASRTPLNIWTSILSPAPNLAACLSQLKTYDAMVPTNHRGRTRRCWCALVRDPANWQHLHTPPTGNLCPNDGVHRWMGSAAQDRRATWLSAIALSTGQLCTRHPLHRQAGWRPTRYPAFGEGVVINGSGVQTHPTRAGATTPP